MTTPTQTPPATNPLSELEAMKASVAAAFDAPTASKAPSPGLDVFAEFKAPVPTTSSILGDLRKQLDAEAKAAAEAADASRVVAAKPVQAIASVAVSYRSPADGIVRDAVVTARVLIKTDERMMLHRLARIVLAAPWESASFAAREEAYVQATCQLQWEEDPSVPAWFKAAYMTDTAFAGALAEEVAALQDAYFQGHDSEGHVAASRRFMVKRST